MIYPASPCCQEIEGPYAWRHIVRKHSSTCTQGKHCLLSPDPPDMSLKFDGSALVYPHGPKWSQCLPQSLIDRPNLKLIVEEAISMGCIQFRLPSLTAVAGGVLQHALKSMEDLFSKYSPMIFKVGWTHNPVWRWSNSLYGYQTCSDNFDSMTVLFISDEPYSPAMLEAALIEKYQGTLIWKMDQHFGKHLHVWIRLWRSSS